MPQRLKFLHPPSCIRRQPSSGQNRKIFQCNDKSPHHHTNQYFILCLNALLIPEFLTIQKPFQMSTNSDTSIFDGFVLTCLISYHIHNYYNHSYHFRCVHLFYHIFVLNASPKNIVNSSFVATFPCHAIMRSRWLFKETSPVPVEQLGRVGSRLDNHLVSNLGRF